jgi:hypothetical protein
MTKFHCEDGPCSCGFGEVGIRHCLDPYDWCSPLGLFGKSEEHCGLCSKCEAIIPFSQKETPVLLPSITGTVFQYVTCSRYP